MIAGKYEFLVTGVNEFGQVGLTISDKKVSIATLVSHDLFNQMIDKTSTEVEKILNRIFVAERKQINEVLKKTASEALDIPNDLGITPRQINILKRAFGLIFKTWNECGYNLSIQGHFVLQGCLRRLNYFIREDKYTHYHDYWFPSENIGKETPTDYKWE